MNQFNTNKRKLERPELPIKRTKKQDHLDSLPNCLLTLIMTYFTQNFLFSHVSLVCKRWREVAKAPPLWDFFDFSGFKVTTMSDIRNLLLVISPNGEFRGKISIPVSLKRINAQEFKKLRKDFPLISGFYIPCSFDSTSLSNSALKEISQFTSLKTLQMFNHSKITDEGIDFLTKKQSNLQNLHLNSCYGLSRNVLSFITERCQKIQSVSFTQGEKGKNLLTDEDLLNLSMLGRNLKECNLDLGSISSTTFYQFIQSCPNLEKIQIRGPKLESNWIQNLFKNLKKLKELLIYSETDLNCKTLENDSIEVLQFLKLKNFSSEILCKNLKILSFEQCEAISDIKIGRHPSIQEFKIRSSTCYNNLSQVINSTSILSLELFDLRLPTIDQVHFKSDSLKKLVFFMCDQVKELTIDGKNISNISVDLCMQMKKLNIKAPIMEVAQLFILPQNVFPQLTHVEIESQKLTSLNLQRAINLEEATFKCESLDALNLAGCRELKKFPVLECPKLDKLALGSQHLHFSMDCVTKLTNDCPSISMLSISNASKLADECLAVLCDKLKRLQALVISNCISLKSPNLDAPNLKGIFSKTFKFRYPNDRLYQCY